MSVSRHRILTSFAVAAVTSVLHAQVPQQPIAYSVSLDAILSPMTILGYNALNLFNRNTGHQYIEVPYAIQRISLDATGTRAAVKHSGAFSLLDLANRTLLRTVQTPGVPDSAFALLGNDWVYIPGSGSYRISTGNWTPHQSPAPFAEAALAPDGSAIYAYPLGEPGFLKIDTSAGPMGPQRLLPGDHCGPDSLWFSNNGARLYTRCGVVMDLPSAGGGDPQYYSELSDPAYLSFVQDPGQGKGVKVWNGFVSVFDTTTLRTLNSFYVYRASAAFLNAGGDSLQVISPEGSQRFDLRVASTSCFPTFQSESTSREVGGTGGTVTLSVGPTEAACQYQVTSNATWAELVESVDGKSGGSFANFRVVVRPNLTGVPRIATFTLGSQTATITQAPLQKLVLQKLSVGVRDAEFNRLNNTLVFVSRTPDELHIYDPAAGASSFVRLNVTPLSVAVQPDGRLAAVGHPGFITLVSLEARALIQQIKIPYPAQDIVLPGNGYIYVFANRDHWGYYNLNTNVWTTVNSPVNSAVAKLNPALQAIYVNGEKWSIANGVPVKVPWLSPGVSCASTSMSELGDLRVGCGNIYEASNDPAREGQVVAALPPGYFGLPWDHSASRQAFATVFGIPSAIHVLSERTAAPLARIDLPGYDGDFLSESRSVFWNREGTRLYAIVTPFIPGIPNPGAAAIGEFPLPGTCPLQLSTNAVNAPSTGASGQIVVNAPPGCSFAATRVPNWVRITNITPTSFQYEVLPNNTTQLRTQRIGVGTASLLFTQAATSGTVTLSPSSLTYGPGVASLSVTIQTSSPNLEWTLTNLTRDVVLIDNTTGAGTRTLEIFVFFNASSETRNGLLLINGMPLPITVAGRNGELSGARPVTLLDSQGTPVVASVGNSAEARADNTLADSRWLRVAVAGPTQLTVSATPNLSGSYRTGYFITANGDRHRVLQSPSPGLRYYPVAPCRLADTRIVNSPLGSSFLAAGTARTFPVHGGPCGIPTAATAFALNVTVVPRGTLGYLTVYPAGAERPIISLLNSLDGRVKAAFTVVNAGAPGGGISLFANNDTDVVIDIAGYFAPETTPGLLFFPVAPCRVKDTRENGSALRAGVRQSIEVAGKCGVPSTAQVFSLNATAIPRTTLGYLQVWPSGQAQPEVSTLNATTGAITANALFAPAGTDGMVDVFANGDTDLVLDINGYFDYPDGLSSALAYYRAEPCRMYDTRDTGVPLSPANAYREIPGYGVCGLPAGAYSLMNVTAVPQEPLGYLTVWPNGDRPLVSTLNAGDGQLTSNAAIVEQSFFPGNFRVFGSGSTHVFFDLTGYFGRF